jgi:hypothetical protein
VVGVTLIVVTSLPIWTVWALGFGSPAVTAAITLFGQHLNRRNAKELESRSRREEILRNLRWAAELAISDDVGRARLGVLQLQELRNSNLLSSNEEGLIDSALRAAIEAPRQAIVHAGSDVQVVVATGHGPAEGELVSSKDAGKQEEASSDG